MGPGLFSPEDASLDAFMHRLVRFNGAGLIQPGGLGLAKIQKVRITKLQWGRAYSARRTPD